MSGISDDKEPLTVHLSREAMIEYLDGLDLASFLKHADDEVVVKIFELLMEG